MMPSTEIPEPDESLFGCAAAGLGLGRDGLIARMRRSQAGEVSDERGDDRRQRGNS
jgi:hypothetical protein